VQIPARSHQYLSIKSMSNRTVLASLATLALAFSMTGCMGVSLEEKQNEVPPEKPKITFSTTEGDFVIGVLPKNAPNSVEKFISWCKGFTTPEGQIVESIYNGLQFYRVMPGKFVQGGDPFNNGTGSDAFKIPFEKTEKKLKRGVVCLANDGEGNNNCIFFILLVDTPQFQGKYTAVGEVLQGLDVIDRMSNVPTRPDEPNTPLRNISIIGVKVSE